MTANDKKENLEKLYDYHRESLAELGIKDFVLLGKVPFKSGPKQEYHVGFFQSEMYKKKDIYIEFTDSMNIPSDPDRTLYKLSYNPHFEEEYEKTGSETSVRYLVPADELKIIKRYTPKAKIKIKEIEQEPEIKSKKPLVNQVLETVDFDIPDPEKDPLIAELTIRDLAAILLKKPVSNKAWLNEIIKK